MKNPKIFFNDEEMHFPYIIQASVRLFVDMQINFCGLEISSVILNGEIVLNQNNPDMAEYEDSVCGFDSIHLYTEDKSRDGMSQKIVDQFKVVTIALIEDQKKNKFFNMSNVNILKDIVKDMEQFYDLFIDEYRAEQMELEREIRDKIHGTKE